MKQTLAAAALTAALLTHAIIPASAQGAYGDTQLSYQNGIVYDDDLVPGRGLNQPFLVGEQSGNRRVNTRLDGVYSPGTRPIPQNSRNLIGADGRIR